MVEEVMKGVYRIPVPLPNNPLRELNSYLIRGKDESILIDTGFRQDACRTALQEGLDALGVHREDLTVLATHLHSDHTGLAPEFVGRGHHIYISALDLDRMNRYIDGGKKDWTGINAMYMAAGFSMDTLKTINETNPARAMAPSDLSAFVTIEEGRVFSVGGYRLRPVLMQGHTPGELCFWLEEQGAMFTGDHVLFDISPNIVAWEGVDNSLKDYLDSLKAMRGYDVRIPLPGHRKPGDLNERIEFLLEHHQARLEEALTVVKKRGGQDAYNIAGYMTWKIRSRNWEEFPLTQKWFAVGECVAHLEYLLAEGRVRREADEGGIYRYFAN